MEGNFLIKTIVRDIKILHIKKTQNNIKDKHKKN
jgi:hypothetical protein